MESEGQRLLVNQQTYTYPPQQSSRWRDGARGALETLGGAYLLVTQFLCQDETSPALRWAGVAVSVGLVADGLFNLYRTFTASPAPLRGDTEMPLPNETASQITNLQNQLREAHGELETTRQRSGALQERFTISQTELQEARDTVTAKTTELELLASELAALTASEAATGGELVGQQEQTAKLKADLAATQEKLRIATARVRDLEAEVDSLTQLKDTAEGTLQTNTTAQQEQTAKLKADLAAAQEELKATTARVSDLEAEVDTLTQLKETAEGTLQTNTKAHRKQIADLRAEINNTNETVTRLEGELDAATKGDIKSELQAQLASAQAAQAVAEEALEQAEAALAKYQEEMEQAVESLSKKQESIESALKQAQEDTERLKAENRELETQVSTLQRDKSRLQTDKENFGGKLDGLQATHNKLKAALQEKNQTITRLEKQLAELTAWADDAEASTQENLQVIADLNELLSAYTQLGKGHLESSHTVEDLDPHSFKHPELQMMALNFNYLRAVIQDPNSDYGSLNTSGFLSSDGGSVSGSPTKPRPSNSGSDGASTSGARRGLNYGDQEITTW